ncbi:uncharacterized protein LOC131205078 isoform X1 [Ahaetulla prasina]|uniref:uncharacterized protein LOC131205078 isoform X1 n=1 Tax=Ahaetulla prasina TaxID=499056 RepID=UPI0026493921|nr:uncharacterized protein LOC131205078 isoform X1 [Ahaetulla prasina]
MQAAAHARLPQTGGGGGGRGGARGRARQPQCGLALALMYIYSIYPLSPAGAAQRPCVLRRKESPRNRLGRQTLLFFFFSLFFLPLPCDSKKDAGFRVLQSSSSRPNQVGTRTLRLLAIDPKSSSWLSCLSNPVRSLRSAVLNLWVATPLGGRMTICQRSPKTIENMGSILASRRIANRAPMGLDGDEQTSTQPIQDGVAVDAGVPVQSASSVADCGGRVTGPQGVGSQLRRSPGCTAVVGRTLDGRCQGSFLSGSPDPPTASLPGPGFVMHGHSCPRYFPPGLLQCSLHGAPLKEHQETSTGTECGCAGDRGSVSELPYNTSPTQAALVASGLLRAIQGVGDHL